MSDLQGKIALITGGGKGVGRAVAHEFVHQGATVVINYFHSRDAARRTQAELTEMGGQVHLIRASVAKQEHVHRMFDEIERLVSGIDILVNNAASGALVPFEDLEEGHWRRAFATNLNGSLWCAQRAAPMMAARGGGSIVNLSSIGAGLVISNYLPVGTSKAAVESLTRYLAVQWAPVNIRVNTASCSLIDGEVAQLFPDAVEMQRVTAAATPLGRLATATDLANVVLFLASEKSAWITGQTILADGGLSLANAILSPPRDFTRPAQSPQPPVPTKPAAPSTRKPTEAEPPSCPTVSPTVEGTQSKKHAEADDDRTVAVVGMGLVVPGASSPEEFWQVRLRGDVVFTEPGARWDLDSYYSPDPSAEDRTYSRKGGYITDPAQYPADPAADYPTFWLRNALRQALNGVTTEHSDRWSVAIGFTADGSQHLEEALVATGLRERLGDLIPDRRAELDDLIRHCLPRSGENAFEYLPHMIGQRAIAGLLPADANPVMVDTACSSSLYAIDIGMKNLLSGASDVAACGGAFCLGPRGSTLFSKLHGLSKSGSVRALDKDSDGVLFSDGAAVVLLKTLRRARADGDQVLGVLAGLGASSDGKGKAIYAPSAHGQQIAVERAQQAAGASPADIDWVLAHATGTPAGDLAEFESLRATMQSADGTLVTSNKSLIGHTGWTAGVVSLIEILLALRHELIPPQYEFNEAPTELEIGETNLEIPANAQRWPSKKPARTAALSGFGFGGTNAHLVVRDRAVPTDTKIARTDEPIAVVGWSAALPGDPSADEVTAWLHGKAPGPDATYGDAYPLPPFTEVRIPRATLRAIDRCQLMILKCVADLAPQLSGFWASVRDTTGVLVGHMGPTRNATLYSLRCYFHHLGRAIASHPQWAGDPTVRQAFASFQATVSKLVPPGNENSFPGIMPNVIPARVANYHDFHGPNIAVDTGFSAGFIAVQLASDYLRWGELDLALVCGINGNSTSELRHILSPALGADAEIGEGAFMLALTRESTARAQKLPVMGVIREAPSSVVTELNCDPGTVDRSYLAGDGVKALIRAMTGTDSAVKIFSRDPLSSRATAITIRVPEAKASDSPTAAHPTTVQRHTVRLKPQRRLRIHPSNPAVGSDTLVLTDDPALADEIAQRNAMVVCVGGNAVPSHRDDVLRLSAIDATSFDQLPTEWRERARSLCVVSRLSDPALGATDATLHLHDGAFLVLQALHRELATRNGSFRTLLLSSVPDGTPHPVSGLFTGLVKTAALELAEVRCCAVLTDIDDLDTGLNQLAEEAEAQHLLPVVVYHRDQRQTFVAVAEPADCSDGVGLGRSSVIVAFGGGRGITAECLIAAAAASSAKIWVVGSNALGSYPAAVYTGTKEDFDQRRAEFISDGLRDSPGTSVAELNRQFDRMAQARTVRHNLDRMAKHSGEDRTRYLTCDIGDPQAVQQTLQLIHDEDGRIDLLINGAGLNRAGALANKGLDEFRHIRDIKVRGYTNLRRAFTESDLPQPVVWCNFGSLVGFTGQQGEFDYAAANDFLASAATYSNVVAGQDEVTIGWTLWSDVGLGANPVTKAFMQRSGLFTGMGTDEGVRHFLDEWKLPHRWPHVVHIGDTERAAIEARVPGLLRSSDIPATPSRTSFFLTTRLSDEPNRLVWERTLDLNADSYLADHLVNGIPTLPGTLVTAIAAEAAVALRPGWHVTAITNLVFNKFLRVYPGRPGTTFRVVAEATSDNGTESLVTVCVLSDLHARDGRILQRDRMHFRIEVHLQPNLPPAPVTALPTSTQEMSVIDPYHVPNSAVRLGVSFISTTSTRVHPGGARAAFSLPAERQHHAFAKFNVPAVLLDGLARTAVLTSDRFVPLAAPLSIGRIDFYDDRNDVELADAFGDRILLYRTNGSVLEDADGIGELGAVAPDGRLIVQIRCLRGIPLGYIDTETNEFLTPTQKMRLDQPQAN
jgi:NAD(P)-dependent dehydrogenase (short-subunit alcohol dehydrogenase family)/3-oxoacyl-(acyl-carrier-protein) synthase